ncbi:hypothetical protein [Methylobrevis pamukkalensis]|uniref:Uncharacterized protein n=1 Tax=Methylobrevis pamukkalensis TaxID=1439726 RepID=A0A1E3H7R4_9HYPH|nr:hypothetical protein [Methylobrevis pamukkalensis]ODN72195.1 hypothetical protein A6302_00493 [Methylobrevis pamukkalensis]
MTRALAALPAAPRRVADLADLAPATKVTFRFGRDGIREGIVDGPVRKICDSRGSGVRSLPVRLGGCIIGVIAADLIDPQVTPATRAKRARDETRQGSLL